MTTTFLSIGKCVIFSVLHQQSNILKERHLIYIHRKSVVEKEGYLTTNFLCSLLFIFIYSKT